MHQYQVKQLVFASTSAVYGDRSDPLQEDSGPLRPISFYGAAKLASEAYISACVENHGLQAWIFRFPNVIGERLTHGVIFDFINRLTTNPKELRILGDGTQQKPYLYVHDLIEAILFCQAKSDNKLNIFNIGVDSATSVSSIAKIVTTEMGLTDVQFNYTGGNRGWVGDVPRFEYDLSRIHKLGWKAKLSSDDAVRITVQAELKRWQIEK